MSATMRLLIAALGGEGGGLLTDWLVEAARRDGLAAQATSVPGVAQRTGATTYYLEFARPDHSGRAPVFALMPVAGDVDLVVASELLEAARMAERGFIAPDRTFLLASSHRVLTTREKMAAGDGRFDSGALTRALETASRERLLLDAKGLAEVEDAPLNAVLCGALAGLDWLPIAAGTLRTVIASGGKAVERNLRGFDAGLAAARGETAEAVAKSAPEAPPRLTIPAELEERLDRIPDAVREIARLGVARLIDYQDAAYAVLYLDRLEPFLDEPGLAREVARHLAVRMAYE
ncbi:MAG TPA: 2-oxoacid:acceptor oxidoreductase family protein, partial [Kiloniellales bacterium]|nr:2-oxoacid:acceptor oxidoreductase family protein [Kiloniellales bacterium]